MTQNKLYVVGLTGGIACGKSHLTQALVEHGAPIVDADLVSRSITAPGMPALDQLRQVFGDSIFTNGSLNRRALASIVFADKVRLETLNSILHPLILAAMDQQIAAMCEQPCVVAVVPLLYETGYNSRCDEIWCAYVPQKEQVRRLITRDGLTTREALRRIRSQMPALHKARLSDRVIRTDGSPSESAAKVVTLWQDVLRRYALV